MTENRVSASTRRHLTEILDGLKRMKEREDYAAEEMLERARDHLDQAQALVARIKNEIDEAER